MKQLKIPHLGENVSDSVILTSHLEEGKKIEKDEIILELETEKATVEIPAEFSGTIQKVLVKTGDKVSSGIVVAELSEESETEKQAEKKATPSNTPKSASSTKELFLQDLGDGIKEVGVLEVFVKVGETISSGDNLFEAETEKATLEIPASSSGTIQELFVQKGKNIKIGEKILSLEVIEAVEQAEASTKPTAETPTIAETPAIAETPTKPVAEPKEVAKASDSSSRHKILVPASPIVRRFAREIGVDLTQVSGSLSRGRISIEDVKAYAKNSKTSGVSSVNVSLPDFTAWGEVEYKDLSKLKQVTAKNMHQTWITVPHVTNFHEVDITAMEKFRKKYQSLAEKKGVKLTVTTFILKVCSLALAKFPEFNASYDSKNLQLILKKYINIGIAVDTPNGLMVPVLQNINEKDIFTLAAEMAELSQKARDRKLAPDKLQGQSFTVSSLGGVGDVRNFTPIINFPDVAILGVSRAKELPRYLDQELQPRLILPLSLSYDHRVIDGAEATRFMNFLVSLLEDPYFLWLT